MLVPYNVTIGFLLCVWICVYKGNENICYSSLIAVEMVHSTWLGFCCIEHCFAWPLCQQALPM